jgi:hypothetical protein
VESGKETELDRSKPSGFEFEFEFEFEFGFGFGFGFGFEFEFEFEFGYKFDGREDMFDGVTRDLTGRFSCELTCFKDCENNSFEFKSRIGTSCSATT